MNATEAERKKTVAYSTNHGGVKSEIVGVLTDSGDLSALRPSISFSIQWRQKVDAWSSDAGKWCRLATVYVVTVLVALGLVFRYQRSDGRT